MANDKFSPPFRFYVTCHMQIPTGYSVAKQRAMDFVGKLMLIKCIFYNLLSFSRILCGKSI